MFRATLFIIDENGKEKIENLSEMGFVSVSSNRIIDDTLKEKLYEDVEKLLSGIIKEDMIKKLVEY